MIFLIQFYFISILVSIIIFNVILILIFIVIFIFIFIVISILILISILVFCVPHYCNFITVRAFRVLESECQQMYCFVSKFWFWYELVHSLFCSRHLAHPSPMVQSSTLKSRYSDFRTGLYQKKVLVTNQQTDRQTENITQ